ncbi:iron-sulfur cluster carrier protein ApbC [Galenea microaerophila]
MNLLNKFFGNGIDAEQQKQIDTALSEVVDPFLEQNLQSLKVLKKAELKKGILNLALSYPYPANSLFLSYEQQLTDKLKQIPNVKQVIYHWSIQVEAHQTQGNLAPLPGVKNIIAIASGKGGVGKSTTSVNLALALQQEGAQVAILDADIYGPSIPTMLGVFDKPQSKDGQSMQPLTAYGLQVMSIGFLIEPDSPMIWRGPIVTQTLTQLLQETAWEAVDYLIIDLPPGTGDVQLTLSQKIPVTGAVIVTTPQEVSLIDARKGLKMFEKVNIDILGIIENMSTHICSNCGYEEPIFGQGGGKAMAESYHVPFLAALPLDIRIREEVDAGKPTVVAEPASEIALKYKNIAHQIAAKLAKKKKNYAGAFPKIEIVNN